MKKIQTLNEELNRMKNLMNFKLGQKSADLLKEQEEPIDNQEEPIDNQEECITVKHTGTFAVDEHVGSDAFNQFMSKIKEQISTLGDSRKTLKSIKVFGGASNHYNGKSVNPDWSNDWEVSDNQSYERDKNSEEYKYNKELAAKRAKNVVNKMTGIGGLFEELGVVFEQTDIDDVLTNMKGYIIDTGGKNDDEKLDKYKPGQIVNLELEICGRIGKQNKECYEDIIIELVYDRDDYDRAKQQFSGTKQPGQKGYALHTCNHAVFYLYANGHKLKRVSEYGVQEYASLNNNCSSGKGMCWDTAEVLPGEEEKTVYSNQYKFGEKNLTLKPYRKNTFILSSKEGVNKEFFDNPDNYKDGNLVITVECNQIGEGWNNQGGCHKGVGTIKVTTRNKGEEKIEITTPNNDGEKIEIYNEKVCENL